MDWRTRSHDGHHRNSSNLNDHNYFNDNPGDVLSHRSSPGSSPVMLSPDVEDEVDASEFPTVQMFALGKALQTQLAYVPAIADLINQFPALCRIAEPIALTSVAPYAYDLMKLLVTGDKSNAAFYAGLFFAAFSLAETLTGVLWGTLSDHIGRKPVLLLGCGGTIVSVLIIGLAPNVWVAILGRALGGALNGNVGVVQTVVAELTTNPKHEGRSQASSVTHQTSSLTAV
ncbi:MAG: hypothetical protein Q9195_008846 [Heterodermia aff. obscurata]